MLKGPTRKLEGDTFSGTTVIGQRVLVLTMVVVRHWYMLSRVVDASYTEVFKTRLDRALGKVF